MGKGLILPSGGNHVVFLVFQIGKGIHQGCILSPCLFNLYAEYIMRNAGLEEAQAGIIEVMELSFRIETCLPKLKPVPPVLASKVQTTTELSY